MSDNNLTAVLQNYFDGATDKIRRAIADTATALAKSAAEKAPESLKDSIAADLSSDGFSAHISSHSPNASLAEYAATASPHTAHIRAATTLPHHAPPIGEHTRVLTHTSIHAAGEHRRDLKAHLSKKQEQNRPFLNPAFEEQVPIFLAQLQTILKA